MGIAIVGGGIAGCYCAYRLAGADAGALDIYELSDRVGGRLWSVWLDGCDAAPVELGAAFFSTLQSNVHGLVTRELRLACTPVDWSRERLFLRGKHLTDESFDDPASIPFNLNPGEERRTPHGLLAYVLGRIVPGFTELWPFNQAPPASSSATHAHLRSLRHEGRRLHDCGFWNVLSDVASNEAYQVLTSTIGSISFFRNSNAFDAIWSLLQELGPQQFYRIDAGYQSLAQTLWDARGDRIERHLEHRLARLDRVDGAFVLSFETPAGTTQKRASHVILALPQHALQRVEFGDGVFPDRGAFERLRDDAVQPMPASKLFLKFDAPWWPSPARGPAAVAASYTDLPMQQCYYFGRAQADSAGILMASLADDVSVSFWRALSGPEQPAYRNPVQGAPGSLQCSSAMVECALRQLALLHAVDATPVPNGAVYVDWQRAPFGAGWHAWSTRIRSWEARKQIRSPAKDLYVCGEAYAARHGWVEGAINSAEMVMQLLGVERPSWVDGSYVFEQEEGEVHMTGQVSELLVALGESSALKRVYDRSPGEIMSAFGLDADDQDAVRSNDLARVKSAAGMEDAAFLIVKPMN